LSVSIDLRLGDCLEILPTLAAGSVDAVVTDPPYGVEWQSNWRDDTFKKIINDDILYLDWIGYINAKYFYCFSKWKTMQSFIDAIKSAGFKVNDILIWDKKSHGAGDLSSYAPCYEMVIYATNNGNKPLFKTRKQNVLRYWRVDGGATGQSTNNLLCHPAQKPVELIRGIIEDCSHPGDTILDPFMGSGTTGVACVQTGRNFIGIEIDPGYFEIAKKRIAQAQLQIRMDI
jgi:site-specific DNA-methyltransferase (adenine-specific)